MPNVAILTDSACDLSQERQQEYQIHVLPFSISLGEKVYEEGVDFTPQEYYELLRNTQDHEEQ